MQQYLAKTSKRAVNTQFLQSNAARLLSHKSIIPLLQNNK
jgi:hypothetical protein